MSSGDGAGSGRGEAGGDPRLEEYVRGLFAVEDEHLREIREAISSGGLPEIQLPAVTARVVQLLLRIAGARRVLEVGTLAGYSALWIARALPDRLEPEDGLLTIEVDPGRATLARTLLERAGVEDRVTVLEGDATSVLPGLGPDGSFDAVFLDADKERLPEYVREARRLLRSGGLLLVDNALWKGQVADPDVRDAATRGVREALAAVRDDPSFDATVLPVGDGLLLGRRTDSG